MGGGIIEGHGRYESVNAEGGYAGRGLARGARVRAGRGANELKKL